MKKNKQETSNFDEVLGMFGNADGQSEVTNMDNEDSFVDIKDDVEDIDNTGQTTEDDDNSTASEDGDDKSPIPQEVLDRMNGKSTKEDNDTQEPAESLGEDAEKQETEEQTNEPTKDDVAEATQVGALFDAVAESLGWDVEDIKDSERPVTVDELVQYMHDTVE